jgi:hypothetical protein
MNKVKFENGIKLNKQWYSKSELRKWIETGKTTIPHSRREFTAAEKRKIGAVKPSAFKEVVEAIELVTRVRFQFMFIKSITPNEKADLYFTNIGENNNTNERFTKVKDSSHSHVVVQKRSKDILVVFTEYDKDAKETSNGIVSIKILYKGPKIVGAITMPAEKPNGSEHLNRNTIKEAVDKAEKWRSKYERSILKGMFHLNLESTKTTKTGKETRTFADIASPVVPRSPPIFSPNSQARLRSLLNEPYTSPSPSRHPGQNRNYGALGRSASRSATRSPASSSSRR